MRNIETGTSATIEQEETAGHRGERIIVEFLKEAFPGLIDNVVESETFDPNDRNGVDFICEIAGQKVAGDITFRDDELRQQKMERTARYPLAFLRDENGKLTGEKIPRVLIYERSMAFWFDCESKANIANTGLIDAMDEANIKNQKNKILEMFHDQIDGLSAMNPEYAKKVEPVRLVLDEEMKKAA